MAQWDPSYISIMSLLTLTDRGLFCEPGDFYVDPWEPVDRAVITHAHGDHATWGSRAYLTAEPGYSVLRARMEPNASIRGLRYGEGISINGVTVSLHPAGHILGSAQVRVVHRGEVWVVSGDYKTDPDPTCTPFQPVRCHTFITESTFGLPIYRWQPTEMTVEIDGDRRQALLLEALAMNGDYTAGGMWVAPDASPDDGAFDVVLIGAFSKAEFATTFPKIYRGRHVSHAKVEIVRARELRVDAPSPLPIVLDGEQPGTTPVRFELVPGALRVRVPDV